MFFCHLSSFLKQQFLFLFHFQLCLDFFKTWLANRLEVPISYNFLSKICFQIPACFGFLTSFLQLRSFGYLALMSTWQTMHIFAALGDEKKDIFFSQLLALKYPLLLIVFINLTVRHFFQPYSEYLLQRYYFTLTFLAVHCSPVSALVFLESTNETSLTSKKCRLAKFCKVDAWS